MYMYLFISKIGGFLQLLYVSIPINDKKNIYMYMYIGNNDGEQKRGKSGRSWGGVGGGVKRCCKKLLFPKLVDIVYQCHFLGCVDLVNQ